MTTILLIEDDEALGSQVVSHLRQADYVPVWWRKGRLLSSDELAGVSLVILDLMLPAVSGLDVLRQLRTISDVPVLVLSARQDSRDKVTALALGADDYMTKPFWPAELLARVEARLRRPALERSGWLTMGSLAIHTEKRLALYDDKALDLTRVEFDLLLALARRVGRPITRAWLLMNVLDPEREATRRTLDVHVSRLRKKLGNSKLIETVWGIGYRLVEERKPHETT